MSAACKKVNRAKTNGQWRSKVRHLGLTRFRRLPLAALACVLIGSCAGASGQAAPSALANGGCIPSNSGSPFIPVDSWIYPAMLRLYGLGYIDAMYLGVRPWTRASVERMLEEADAHLIEDNDQDSVEARESREIYRAVNYQLKPDIEGPCGAHQGSSRIESTYSMFRGISGMPLRDSFHLGSTITNDYGRHYENGLNNYSGISGYATWGRFAFYARGEFQGSPSGAGYPAALAETLSKVDGTTFLNPVTGAAYNQATIPAGPIASISQGRLLEGYVSFQYLNHVFSFGKEDEWLGPAQGGSFAYSNNAENIYAFHINRIEPLRVPLLSRFTGAFRYEFLIGQLRGHTLMPNPLYQAHPSSTIANVINPGNPWVHLEKISMRPTENLELGFERTALFGGEGHSPVTLHTFLKSFFSTSAGTAADKNGRNDPGARFASFDFSYRVPFLRKWLTWYTDGEVHDDVSPIDAPRRASWRPGLYLSHVPGIPKLDLRFEAAMTDPSVSTSHGGRFMYWEEIEKQGYTNQGQIFGDWIGREDKGGQAWLTYHLSGNEWVQLSFRNQKAAKDFISGGTTLNDGSVQIVKRLRKDFEVNGTFALEHWRAPIFQPGPQTVTTTNIQITWFPQRKVTF